MSAKRARSALLVALLLAPLLALAETWAPAEVAEAERFRAEEAARAAAYRERVARGDVRAAAAPMPREAPQTPDGPSGEPLRKAADIVDLLERWFGKNDQEAQPAPEREPTREELRRRSRERRRDGADAWWDEEERRTRSPR